MTAKERIEIALQAIKYKSGIAFKCSDMKIKRKAGVEYFNIDFEHERASGINPVFRKLESAVHFTPTLQKVEPNGYSKAAVYFKI